MRALTVSLLTLALAASAALGAQVTSLPGFSGEFPGNVYSGYMTVNETTGREIFYMFFEAFTDAETRPLSLWLTGGPGCSGLMAAFTESGPFQMNFTADGAGVQLNPYSWSNAMSMIYIESPVGVGFSNVPGQTTGYVTGDKQTADDTYAFMQGFYKEYPQYKGNDFWVTGESYGGHYVPEAVNRILDGNMNVNTTGDFKIPIKGWMVGNPWTYPEVEAFGVVQNWWDRAIIGRPDWDDIQAFCDYKDITFWIINNATAGIGRTRKQQAQWWTHNLAEARARGEFKSDNSHLCFDALYRASDVEFNKVDILGIYRDMCVPGVEQYPHQINPCAATQMVEYLNRQDVRAAIHASLTVPATWEPCSAPPHLTYSTLDTQLPVVYVYERAFHETDLKVLVYSGDNDAIVPYTGTRMWIERLNRPIVKQYHQWFSDSNGQQVGGWSQQYDTFTFVTVRGAGHLVPYMQPERALQMIQNFITNHTM